MKSVPIVFAVWDGVDAPCMSRVPLSHLVSAIRMWKKGRGGRSLGLEVDMGGKWEGREQR